MLRSVLLPEPDSPTTATTPIVKAIDVPGEKLNSLEELWSVTIFHSMKYQEKCKFFIQYTDRSILL